MKKYLWTLAAALISFSACQKETSRVVTLVVTNPVNHNTNGVVDGISLKAVLDSLHVEAGTPIHLTDELGKPVCTQIFNNGDEDLLLFESSTLANGESVYYVSVGIDSCKDSYEPAVFMKHYPERKDDFLWENESAIWRAYGPTLQETGERAFGYDVWVKNTHSLCGDARMMRSINNHALADSLSALEQFELADSIRLAGNFHHNHGDGMDCYAVGPTLGGGTAALVDNGQLVLPWAWKHHKVLANGPLLAAVTLDYDTLYVGNDTVLEHRTIVAQKGTRFNIINVKYDGLSEPHDIAVGIVYHADEDSVKLNTQRKYMAYSDPTDQPSENSGRVLVGVYSPTTVRTVLELGHLLCYSHYKPGETFTYYMGSGWSKGDCASLSVMEKELREMSEEPRTVRIVVK